MTRRRTSRIVMYSMNYADWLQRTLPYVPYSAERGLCHLAELSDPDANVIAITLKPIDQRVVAHHLAELCGSAPGGLSARDRVCLLVPAETDALRLDARVLADAAIMDRLRQEVASGAAVSITNFAASPASERLAATLGVPLEESRYELAEKWGGKTGSKEVLRRSGARVAPGADRIKDERELVEAVRMLASPPVSARRAILKLNDPSWGGAVGSCLLDCDRLLAGDIEAAIDRAYQPWRVLMDGLATGGGIVEEHVEGTIASPSGTGHIAADRTVRLVATHDQIIKGGQYWGCVFPSDEPWRTRVVASVVRIGTVLASLGVRGTFGVDFVVLPDGTLIALEINLRKVGSSHVVTTVESLAGGTSVGSDGLLKVGGGSVHYVHRRVQRPEVLRGRDPMDLLERLSKRSLLFSRQTGTGATLHMLGAVRSGGYLELTSVARSRETAASLDAVLTAELFGDRDGGW